MSVPIKDIARRSIEIKDHAIPGNKDGQKGFDKLEN
jgi:hypothetical protein